MANSILQFRRGASIPNLLTSELFWDEINDTLVVGNSPAGSTHTVLTNLNTLNDGSLILSGDVTASNASFSGTVKINNDVIIGGSIILGDNPVDQIDLNGVLSGSLIPSSPSTFNIASSGNRYSTLFVDTLNVTNGITASSVDRTNITNPDGLVSGSSQVSISATSGFEVNRFIDHQNISVLSGNGLSGGGTMDTTKSLTLNTGSLHFTNGVKTKLNQDGVISGSSQLTGSYDIRYQLSGSTTNAEDLTSGILPDARLSTNITTEGNTFNGNDQLVKTDATGRLPAIDGSQLTGLTSGDTASEILAKLITVDGTGSELDADRLRNFLPSIPSADSTIPIRNQFGQLRSRWFASDNNVENGIHFSFDFTDRPWSFSQGGSGTSATLDLLSNTSANSFRIGTISSRDEIVINPVNGNITTQGSFIGDGSQLTGLPGGTNITSLNNFTSSVQNEVDSLTSVTGSYLTTLPSNLISGSSQLTGSYDVRYQLSGSTDAGGADWNVNLDNIPSGIISGSTQITNGSTILSGSKTNITSLNNFTSSIQTEVNGLSSVTGSYLTTLPNNLVSGSTQITNGSTILSGSKTNITSLNNFTSSIQTEVNGISSVTSSYLTTLPTGTVSGSTQITNGSTLLSGSKTNITSLNNFTSSIQTQVNSRANLSGSTFTGDLTVVDDVYDSSWNSNLTVPTKNSIYDEVETRLDGKTLITLTQAAFDALTPNTDTLYFINNVSGSTDTNTTYTAGTGLELTGTVFSQTSRTINGTTYNGSSNITTANWGTSRNISIGGTSKSVNGSGNVTWTAAEIGITKSAIDALNIDADTLDSLNSTQFLRSDQSDTINGNLTVTGDLSSQGSPVWTSGNDGAGSGLDAGLYQGFDITVSGNRWGVISPVEASGVIEIGRFIDFHNTDGSTADRTFRIDNSSTGFLNFQGNINVEDDLTVAQGGRLNLNTNGDGQTLLNFGTERPWSFRQEKTGASTELSLIENSSIGSKWFTIGNQTTTDVIRFSAFDGRIMTGGDITSGGIITGTGVTPFNSLGTGLRSNNTAQNFMIARDSANTPLWFIGISSTSNNDVIINNYDGGAFLKIKDGGEENGLEYYNGSTTRTVWHSGNDGSLLNTSSTSQSKLGALGVKSLQSDWVLTGGNQSNANTVFSDYNVPARGLLVTSNSSSSTNYTSGFGQTLFINGGSDGRNMAIYKVFGGNNDYYLGNSESGAWNWRKIWTDGNDGAGSGLNAGLYHSFNRTVSGNRWGVISPVEGTGVIEIGRYIDFHNTDGSTADNTFRIDNSSTGLLNFEGNIEVDDLTAAGVIITGTATATNFILSSDRRLKENIQDLDIPHIPTAWKSFTMGKGTQIRYGVIAQELEETNPEFVRIDDDGMKSVAYIDLLVAKCAEQEKRIEMLESKLELIIKELM